MATTKTEMGLKLWDAPGDFFSYAELSQNFTKINDHDHTSGKGMPLGPNTVAASQLQDNAVGANKIQDGVVTAAKLGAGAGKFTSGLASALPAQPQAIGLNYYATDTKQWYVSTGTAWTEDVAARGVTTQDTNQVVADDGSGSSYTVASLILPVPAQSLFYYQVYFQAQVTVGAGATVVVYPITVAGSLIPYQEDGAIQIHGAGGPSISLTSSMQAYWSNGAGMSTSVAVPVQRDTFPQRIGLPIPVYFPTAGSANLRLRVTPSTSGSVTFRSRKLLAWVQPLA